MSRADVDDFLAELDDVVDDWEGSDDSATWAADGSHEPAELDGDYYVFDSPGSVSPRPFVPFGQVVLGSYQSPRRSLMVGEPRSYDRWAPRALPADDEVFPDAAFRSLWEALSPSRALRAAYVALAFRDMAASAAQAMQGLSMGLVVLDETSRWRNSLDASVLLVPRQRFVPRDVFLRGMDGVTPRPDPWAQTLPQWRTLGVRLLDPPPFRVVRAESVHLPSPPTAGPPPDALGRPRRHVARGATRPMLG